jgi:hypothetical protein
MMDPEEFDRVAKRFLTWVDSDPLASAHQRVAERCAEIGRGLETLDTLEAQKRSGNAVLERWGRRDR